MPYQRASLAGLATTFLCLTAPVTAQTAIAADEPARPTQVVTDNPIPDIALTPAALADALACRSRDAQRAFAAASFVGKAPDWMPAYRANEAKGLAAIRGHRLAQPIALFGRQVGSVFFLDDWIVASLPYADAVKLAEEQRMERAPIQSTEQYYRFLDPAKGPMLGAFEPAGSVLAAVFGVATDGEMPAGPRTATLFVGCNYAPASREVFLKAASEADARFLNAAEGIIRMTNEIRTAIDLRRRTGGDAR